MREGNGGLGGEREDQERYSVTGGKGSGPVIKRGLDRGLKPDFRA